MLPDADQIAWLDSAGAEAEALRKVAFDKQRLDDVGKLSEFCHTGELEVYNSSQLRWVTKRISFSYLGMMARTQVAALHHNYNVGRKQARRSDGQRQWRIVFPKAKRRWVAKKKIIGTTNAPLFDFMDSVYDTAVELQDRVPEALLLFQGVPPTVGVNIATAERPPPE